MPQPAEPLQLSDYFGPDRVALDAPCTSRKAALMQLAELALQERETAQTAQAAKLLGEREKLGSTALGRGLALPHTRMPGLGAPAVAALRLAQAIPFDAPDGEPVQLLFALLVPEDANPVHLDLLAALARALQRPGCHACLKTAATPADFCACLEDV